MPTETLPLGIKLHPYMDVEDGVIVCTSCRRRWRMARIEDVRNQDYLWEHAEHHRPATRRTPRELEAIFPPGEASIEEHEY